MSLAWWALCLVTLSYSCLGAEVDRFTISLDGKWSVSNGNNVTTTGTVPGQTHTDLLAAGLIADPYYRFNDINQRWIAYDNWTYSRYCM